MARGRKRRAGSNIVDDHGETEQAHHHQPQSEYEEEDVEVPELPPEVIVDILSKLPVKSVFTCRRVCKLWLSLISGSDFAKIHLSRSQVSLLVKLISRKRNPRHVQLVDLEIAPFRGSRMKLTPQKNLPRDPEVNFVNSCNGLLCLCDPVTDDPIYVCNPILGEFITLPKCDSGVKCSRLSSAFGFCPTTNQYKVVRSFRRMVLDAVTGKMSYGQYELEMYTLGEGSWRKKGEPSQTISNCNTFNTFLNGAIHWLVYETKQTCFICCFDFAIEQFCQVPEPSEVTLMDNELSPDMGIGVLRGCLSIHYYKAMERLDIWLMKDYGVKESWSKHLVIQNFISTSWQHVISYEPIMIMESGKILFLNSEEIVCLYDPELEKYRQVYCYRRGIYFDGIAHIPSLVSLRDVARGENLKMCSA